MAEAISLTILTLLSIEATAFAVTVTTALVGLGISAGISLLAQAFLRTGVDPGPPPSDRQFISKVPIGPRIRSYGRVRVAGQQVFLNSSNGVLYRILAHNEGLIDGVEEHLINDIVVTVDSNGKVTLPSKYDGRVKIFWRLGTDAQSHYTELQSIFTEWDNTHKGNGVAHSLTMFQQVPQSEFVDVYPSGENTTYKQTIRAVRVWDPRDATQSHNNESTWKWSDNAALVILDYLRHESGLGIPMVWLQPEISSWIAAANACDELVATKDGGAQKRYRIWGTYSYNERPVDVLSRMLTACNGRLWSGSSGGLTLHVGVWTAPTVTLGSAAIVSYKIGSGNEAPETANTLTAVYTERNQGYVEVEAQPWVDEASVLSFGERRSDAKLYMVPTHSQCRRLMKQAFGRLAPDWRGTLTTNLLGLAALSERYVTIVLSDLNLTFTAEIDNAQFRTEAGSIVTGLTIDFTSISANQFTFDALTEEGTPSEVPPTISNSGIPIPNNFNVVIESRNSYSVAVASWTAPTTTTLKTSVEFRNLTRDSSWQSLTSSEGATNLTTTVLAEGETYEFRARHVGLIRSSDWTTSIHREIVVDTIAPDPPTAVALTRVNVDTVKVSWNNSSSLHVYGVRVYRHTTNTPATALQIAVRYGGPNAALEYTNSALDDATYWWWVASINGSGVESARVLAGTVTIP